MAEGMRTMNLRDAVVPMSVIVSIVGGALMIQSRLLSVEFAVGGLRQYMEDRQKLDRERLEMFARSLREMNPTLKVPDIR
jgi:hypothetical protein